jgi:hypothetical protein
MTKKPDLDEPTRQIAERLLRTPPKPHEDMKIAKSKRESARFQKKRRVVNKSAR